MEKYEITFDEIRELLKEKSYHKDDIAELENSMRDNLEYQKNRILSTQWKL